MIPRSVNTLRKAGRRDFSVRTATGLQEYWMPFTNNRYDS